MKLHSLAVATILATTVTAAHAEFTVSPMIGYHFFDGDKNIENSIEGSIALGYEINENIGLELRYGQGNTLNDNGLRKFDIRNEMATLDVYYAFSSFEKLRPYVLIGGGLQRETGKGVFRPAAFARENTIANIASGFFYDISNSLAMRAEMRAVQDLQANDYDSIASVGVTYSFGGNKAAAIAPAAPAAVAVKTDGDDDKDGVANSADKCPGTPTNVVVTADGCTKELVESVSREMRVLFDFDKSVVKPEFHDEIEGIAKLLKEYPAATVEIQGHTDSRGTASYNDDLSQRRADAIANVLTKTYGLSADRISSKGYGAAQPVADNKTAEGRAKNRRSVAVAQGEVKVTVKK